jgi:hypothetical protein
LTKAYLVSLKKLTRELVSLAARVSKLKGEEALASELYGMADTLAGVVDRVEHPENYEGGSN